MLGRRLRDIDVKQGRLYGFNCIRRPSGDQSWLSASP
jgi:hypothetical protein